MSDVLLAFDPSATCTGYAVFDGGWLREVGWIRSRKRGAIAAVRIGEIADEAERLCMSVKADVVVIEVPSGRPGRGLERGARARLSIYGWAVGEVRRACEHAARTYNVDANETPGRVVCVDERTWTRGVHRQHRIARVLADHPTLAPTLRAKDKGADACEAIGIGEWFLAEQQGRDAADVIAAPAPTPPVDGRGGRRRGRA